MLRGSLQQCSAEQLAKTAWACGGLISTAVAAACISELVRQQQHTNAKQVALALHGAATSRTQLPPGQVQQLVAWLVDGLQHAIPQDVSNVLWAVATMGLQLPAQQVQQLVTVLVDKLQQAEPQHVANALWAIAIMQHQLPAQQVQQLVAGLGAKLQQAAPQAVANTLWAVAAMGLQLPEQQVQQLVAVLVAKLQQAAPQAVANTLLVCARLSYLPAQLLAALEADQQQLQQLVAAMKPQEHANAAWACGQLGATGSMALVAAVLQQAALRVERQCSSSSSSSDGKSFNTQDLSNLAWSAAVLDVQSHAAQAQELARACSQQREQAVGEDLWQLYQVHLWLLDGQHAGGKGLLGPLTQAQLQQCKEAWEIELADSTTSQLQADVLAALRRLPHAWQQQPQAEQLAQPDGALSIDITAVTAGDELLAVEVDGPWHFRWPDGGLMGTTLYRNRALAARGYRVVSVPYREWDALENGAVRATGAACM